MSDNEETRPKSQKFDFSLFPEDTLFHDRREILDRRDRAVPEFVAPTIEIVPKSSPERRARKERRRRVDPTTFEKQYSEDEIEFMNAVQNFKTQSGKSFPSHGDVLRIAARLGYRKGFPIDDAEEEDSSSREMEPALPI